MAKVVAGEEEEGEGGEIVADHSCCHRCGRRRQRIDRRQSGSSIGDGGGDDAANTDNLSVCSCLSSVSSVSTPTECTLVPTRAPSTSSIDDNRSVQHYQSVTPSPPPPPPPLELQQQQQQTFLPGDHALPPNQSHSPISSLRSSPHQLVATLNEQLDSLDEMLVEVHVDSDQISGSTASQSCNPPLHHEENRSDGEMLELGKATTALHRGMHRKSSQQRHLLSTTPNDPRDEDCCSCRSIITANTNQHSLMYDDHTPGPPEDAHEKSDKSDTSNPFIIYLFFKKLFSLFRRRKKRKDRRKVRRGKADFDPEGNGEKYLINPNAPTGSKLRRSGSVYSTGRWSSVAYKRPIKLSGANRIPIINNAYNDYRPTSRRYSNNLMFDCEECRREAEYLAAIQQQQQQHHQQQQNFQMRPPPPPLSRRGSRRLHRQVSKRQVAFERFVRQHRYIMSMLSRQRFGVSKMFDQMTSRPDQRPNYQFLNQLLYQGVIRNRMSGYRYNLIRPILADVMEDEAGELQETNQQQQQQQPSSSKSRLRQNRLYQPPPPPPQPVPTPSMQQNCCESAMSVSSRYQKASSRGARRGLDRGPRSGRQSKVSSLVYFNPSTPTPLETFPRRPSALNNSSQSRLVQVPSTTECIDCILSQLKHNRSNSFRRKSSIPPTVPQNPPNSIIIPSVGARPPSGAACACCDYYDLPPPSSPPKDYTRSEFYPNPNRRPHDRTMSTRRRKMLCKKFDSNLVVTEEYQCRTTEKVVTRSEQHYAKNHQNPYSHPRAPSVYQNTPSSQKQSRQVQSRRSSLPTSSASSSSSVGGSSSSTRTSKYMQQCKCCAAGPSSSCGGGGGRKPNERNEANTSTSRHAPKNRFSSSQFMAPNLTANNSAASCSNGAVLTAAALPAKKDSCFCPACIAKLNLTVAKL